jgi:hypothetical protein
MNCRHCSNQLEHIFLDLGFAPPSNNYLSNADLNKSDIYYPLKLFVCEYCWLVQTEDYSKADELFKSDYAYFSSVSQIWLQHAANYMEMITKRLELDSKSYVIEIAANDGYLLKNFVNANIPCLGIEPTNSTAVEAEKKGIPILQEFFGKDLAKKLADNGKKADLIIGNNVFAHVPDINDFTEGLKTALKLDGTITLEFPHLMMLLEHTQFDTVYHEHFSYLSLFSVCQIFKRAGLRVFDVELLKTHGGSLRIFGCHQDDQRSNSPIISQIIQSELDAGMRKIETYKTFQNRANQVKDDLLLFLISQKRAGKKIAAYGAAAKGCTLLNYAGIKTDLLPYVCDASPSKQGKYLPGSHIPIKHPDEIKIHKPDLLLILPWNIQTEIIDQMSVIRDWGGEFCVALPNIKILHQ